MACDARCYYQYLSGDDVGPEVLTKKYGNPLTFYINGNLHDVREAEGWRMRAADMAENRKYLRCVGCSHFSIIAEEITPLLESCFWVALHLCSVRMERKADEA